MRYRCSLVLTIVILLIHSSLFAVDRWGEYLKNDFEQIKRNVNVNTLLWTGGWLTGMYLLSNYDEPLNTSVKSLYTGKWKAYFNTVDHLGNGLYTGPISIGIAGLTLLGNDKKIQDAAFTSAESFFLTGIIMTLSKFIIGRSRPDADKGAHHFSPFSDPTSSFPSGHASTAFALVTPWVVYYPNAFTYLLMIVPASTAIARMALDRHWFTDVLTGSVLGFVIGYNLAKWHKNLAKKNNYYSDEGGADFSVSFSVPIGR
jgi:membrane-associated phospholipid phosphatase